MRNSAEQWPAPSAIMTFDEGDPDENPWVAGRPVPEVIRIEPHAPEWAARFETARAVLAAALHGGARGITHVGSTAVPGLPSKPVIDIDLTVSDPEDEDAYLPHLTALGYRLTVRERTWYHHRMLRHDAPRINLHVFGPGCPEHARHVLFRDWLRTHPDDRDRYATVKRAAGAGAADVQDYNMKKQDEIYRIYHNIFASRGWTAG
ncbi:GrpB family protein [Komagataeibacter oboediens]|uniref:GrpB family protein n=1 Tax=Komagataeibacter oboediens TaxID=65958 RepID=A0ABS5SNT2_9PROT|nr:GrpB family protein [Komagataeibacter oboediens]MBL7233160.1 GrpB family protein [Komagataeibacter oboediens]MBT0675444.1 GrpB family protein [Komagataeibacter oboediens]MBT0679691.1 GrpB family protein [Komagataeibacter oboediens]MBV1825012.1 GrpB family protein [Komagataeibacter oboediens]WEQ51529.1 GrpB family protein [Komagataeibacter oboediens]